MITNDRQYKIAKSQIENFQDALDEFSIGKHANEQIHPRLLELQKKAILVKLNELIEMVREYENLKEGKTIIAEVNDLRDLPVALIKSRIANGLTQSELAERLGMKMQQIQRYEADNYETASLKTLIKIADELGIKVNADVQIRKMESPEHLNVKNYPFKQMFQRGWFGNFIGTYNDAVKDSSELLSMLFERSGLTKLKSVYNKQSIRSNSKFNEYALNAWYASVIIKAKSQIVKEVFSHELLNNIWFRNLAKLSVKKDAPLLAAEYLQNAGIRFVVEPQLEGTLLDGASFLLEDKSPVVALTLRYDRLDNFWFVLFHELAHISLHLTEAFDAIFDNLDDDLEGIEKDADRFALNALIPDEAWRKSLVRFNPTKESIINQAHVLEVHPALIAGRIRKETGRYYEFNDLIGKDEVRKCFKQELNY